MFLARWNRARPPDSVGRASRPPTGRCGMVFEQLLRSRPRRRASHSLAEGVWWLRNSSGIPGWRWG